MRHMIAPTKERVQLEGGDWATVWEIVASTEYEYSGWRDHEEPRPKLLVVRSIPPDYP